MPRVAKPAKPTLPSNTLILDNGAYTIKAGLSTSFEPTIIPNTLAKLPNSKHVYIGAQLSQCKDFAEIVFRRPVQRGQLVNWEAEREIWSQAFFDGASSVVPVDPTQTNLLLTEAPNGLGNLAANTDQIVFEEFEFAGYKRVYAPVLNAYGNVAEVMGDRKSKAAGSAEAEGSGDGMEVDTPMPESSTLAAECVLVVDSGYSHTTITPVFRGRPIQQAIRRLEIGGKFLTNCLKETLSVRQLDLTHEFHIVNELKEDVCYISRDFNKDLERTWKQSPHYDGKKKSTKPLSEDPSATSADFSSTSPDSSIVLDYILPDYTTTFRGRSQPHNPALSKPASKLQHQLAAGSAPDTTITVGNERFTIPELLFHPSDTGLPQAGLPELIMQSVRAMPPGLWTAMLSNVLLVGGNARIPGFADRLFEELRPLAPAECVVRVKGAEEPVGSAWRGGRALVEKAEAQGRLGEVFVSRADYLENGEGWLLRQFHGEKPLPA